MSPRCARRLRGALFALLLLPAALPASTLRERLADGLREEGIPGAVWSSVDSEGRAQVDAVGIADARTGRPMTAETRVQVGSIAKAVLATGVLRLATEGRLSLDAPVTHLLSDVRFDNRWAPRDPVRVRHLLDHTAGLDDLRLRHWLTLEGSPDSPLAAAFEADRPIRIRSRPGARFSYSNTGYTLLARVIEQVTGERYETWLDREVLMPLGMRDSTFAYVTQDGPGGDPRLALGHFEGGAAQPAIPMPVRPAFQFTTTAGDMARYGAFVMGDGRVDGRVLVAPRLMRERGHAVGTKAARAGLRVGYALGLGLLDRGGAAGLCHGGDGVGFRAMFCAFPGSGRAYFIAFNGDVEGGDYARLRGLLVEAIGVRATPRGPSRAVHDDVADWSGFYVPAPGRFEAFAWLDTLAGWIRVDAGADGLHLRPLQGMPLRALPAGGRLFRAPERLHASHVLLRGEEGEYLLANDRQTYRRIPALQLLLLWLSLTLGVLGLAFVLLAGGWRLLARRPWRRDALRWPWLGTVLLALPVALFMRYSFLQIGDVTAASITLALVTGLLPVTMLVGLVHVARRGRDRRDAAAVLAVLQCLAVLAAWDLWPVRTWVL